jgi:ubiquinone/menaquinone biosynthesis C-methylase UbiE
MRLQLRTDRLLIGLRGLALLRGWPFADAAEADAQIDEIRRLSARMELNPEILEVEAHDLDLDGAYAAWSETYDTIANALIAAEEPFVRAFLSEIQPGRTLDVAAGTGRFATILAELGHEVIAADLSLEMLERGRAKGIGASFLRGDMRAIPLRAESVDLAVCGLALTHVQDLGQAIAEIARVVRPGGRMLLSDVHPFAVATGAQAMFKTIDGARGVARNHLHWPSSYLDAFKTAGLAVERVAEPQVDEAFIQELGSEELRDAARSGLVGMPLVLVWLLRKGR